MFNPAARDKSPAPKLEPGAGASLGCYLQHAAAVYGATKSNAVKLHVEGAIKKLAGFQTSAGYVGPWSSKFEFKQGAPNCETPWDVWGHHHVMTGLAEWHVATGSAPAKEVLLHAMDLLASSFQENPADLHTLGAQFTIGSLLGSVAKAVSISKDTEYLELARTLLKFLEMPGAGDLVRKGLAKEPLHKNLVKSWHGLVTLEGVAQLSRYSELANADDLRTCALESWWCLCEHERKINGAVLSGEQALGFPLKPATAASRTSATVAWARLTAEVLGISNLVAVADELELTLCNAGLYTLADTSTGLIPTGGKRMQLAKSVADPASLDVACGPGMFAALASSSVKVVNEQIQVNLYYAGHFKIKLASGNEVTLKISTQYPHSNHVDITVAPRRRGEKFAIALRMPSWSAKNEVSVDLRTANVPDVSSPDPGQYFVVEKGWTDGDQISIDFDFTLRFCKSSSGKACIYRGPILLAYDPARQSPARPDPKTLSLKSMTFVPSVSEGGEGGDPSLLLCLTDTGNDGVLMLCDFASAGVVPSSSFTTWLPIAFSEEPGSVAFTRTNPTRTFVGTAPSGGFERQGKPGDRGSYIDVEVIPAVTTDTRQAHRYHTARVSAPREQPPPAAVSSSAGNPAPLAPRKSVADLSGKFHKTIEEQGASAKNNAHARSADVTTLSDELTKAREFQQSLRKAKKDAEAQANHVASKQRESGGAFPFASTRKASTRKMLNEALGDASQPVSSKQGKPSHEADELLLRSSSYENALDSLGTAKSKRQPSQAHMTASAVHGMGAPAAGSGQEYVMAKQEGSAGSDDEYALADGAETLVPGTRGASERKTSASDLKAQFEAAMPAPDAHTIRRSWKTPWKKTVYDQEGQKVKGEHRKTILKHHKVDSKRKKTMSKSMVKTKTPPPANAPAEKRPSLAGHQSPVVDVGQVAPTQGKAQPTGMGAKSKGDTAGEAAKPKAKWGASEVCYICEKTVFAMEKGEADGMVFHKNCFRCTTCNKVVGIGKYASLESKIYCKTHFKQLFKLKGNYNEGFGTEQHKNKWAGKGKIAALAS